MSHFDFAKNKVTYPGKGKICFLFNQWYSIIKGIPQSHTSRRAAMTAVLGEHLVII